jgi:CHAT domain-containing protein
MRLNIRSLGFTMALTLLPLTGLVTLNVIALESSVAFGETTESTHTHTAEPRRLRTEGELAFQKGKYSEALDKLKQALNLYQKTNLPEKQVEILNLIGSVYGGLSNHEKMKESYQNALNLSREIKNRQEEGIALNGISDVYYQQSKYQKSLEFIQQALKLCSNSSNLKCKALSLRNMGNSYMALLQKEKGLKYSNEALVLYKSMGDHYGEAKTLGDIALVYSWILNKRQEAIEYYNRALQLYKTVGNRNGEASTLMAIGHTYKGLASLEIASIHSEPFDLNSEVQQALGEEVEAQHRIGIFRHDPEKMKDFSNLRKEVYPNLKQKVSSDLGKNQKVLIHFRKALVYYNQALGLWKSENNLKEKAFTFNIIAGLYSDLGDTQKSLIYYNRALVFYKTMADYAGEATILNNLGYLYYFHIGDKQKAVVYYKQALSLFKALGERSSRVLFILERISDFYYLQGEKQKALDYYKQSLLFYRAIGDRDGEISLFLTIGSVYSRLGEKKKALDYYNQALMLRRIEANRNDGETDRLEVGLMDNGEADILRIIGGVYYSMGEEKKALIHYNQALTLYKIQEDSQAADVLFAIGTHFAKEKKSSLAISFYKEAVNIIESTRKKNPVIIIRSTRHPLIIKGLEENTIRRIAKDYRALAALLLQQDRVLEAQQVLDLLKVRELKDYLKTVRGSAQTARGIHYLRPEQQILTRYNELHKNAIQLGQELGQLRGVTEAKQTPAQQERIAQLTQLEEDLNRQFNDFARSSEIVGYLKQLTFEIQQQTVSLSDLDALRDNLKRLNAIILYPLILPDRLELIITTPDSAPLRRTVKVSSTELNQTILEFRQQMKACETKTCTAADTEKVKALSQKLYTWLIKPLEADLKQTNAQSIIYAPDGQLRYIPLAALHDGNQWLAQRLRVNNITAKSLDNLEPQSSKPPLKILAGAFTEGSYQFNVGPQQFSFDGLPFAKKEIAQLVAAVPGTTQFLDQAFSLAAIKPRMNEYNVLHLATHAAFLPGQPENSFILFGNGDRATLRDIENWSLFNIDMVILSACETGLGLKLGDGVEILGLGYQFQNRGVKATIASLWQVNDESTQILMNTLYSQLKQGNTSKAEALRQAQLTLIQGKGQTSSKNRAGISAQPTTGKEASQPTAIDHSHPYYWAPFILIGNGF